MTKEQHQEFIEFALELKWNRDAYSRARIIEELMNKVDELVKNCSIPVVSKSKQIKKETVIKSLPKCKGDKIKNYIAFPKGTFDDDSKTIKDKTPR